MLVVDDDPKIQELIQEYLPASQFEVYAAYDGQESIELYRKLEAKGKKPDLVVMDLNLSGTNKKEDMVKQMKGEAMDGVRTTKEIKEIDPQANVVGYTAFAGMEWGDRLKDAGAQEVYGRDVGFQDFVRKVQQILT
ncbi:MAG: response regulator [Thermoplasmatota archaeon]